MKEEIIKENWKEDLAKIIAFFIKTDPKDYRFYVELKDFIQELQKAQRKDILKDKAGIFDWEAEQIRKLERKDILEKIEGMKKKLPYKGEENLAQIRLNIGYKMALEDVVKLLK